MLRIAIDGPSGSGKSTLAKAIAKDLGIVYVDTGALYRTIGYYVHQNGVEPRDEQGVSALLPEINIEIKYEDGVQHVILNGEDLGDKIRQPHISMYASDVSALPTVRAFLLDMQKDIVRKNSVVMDGRDIGTVIIPDADLKIFLSASDECRARRRTDELLAKGVDARYEDVLAEMIERDKNDKGRDIAPAIPAPDAIMLDNSNMTVEESVNKIKELLGEKTAKKKVKTNKLYAFLYFLLANIIRAVFRIRVIGKENEPSEGGFIVVSNHTSALDPVIVCASMKNQICYMGKKELFKIPLLRGLLKSLGGYPVDRKGNDISAIKLTVNLLRSGKCTGIFPQGTRQPRVNPRDTEVKTGISLIALRSGADVLPVCIKTKGDKAAFFKKTYLIIGEPIKNSELDLEHEKGSEGFSRVSRKIFDKVCDLYDATDIKNEKK